ncbi:hypothetical protein CLNEO_14730 [Anaerotignum neopropionicum]|uniref:Uncharacterized protein n=1 Tax=Anaerotignum neopropionicum TaxID=36847 RepID=A0A136WEM6_9FIRM|nr:hypothetical protein [Anaerotignum neopropionicum]KXL52931.1 hypothetical protein CLNEO_14730 [Anaerotignum neopropionicum]
MWEVEFSLFNCFVIYALIKNSFKIIEKKVIGIGRKNKRLNFSAGEERNDLGEDKWNRRF